jgi:hypothetical protein
MVMVVGDKVWQGIGWVGRLGVEFKKFVGSLVGDIFLGVCCSRLYTYIILLSAHSSIEAENK